MNQAKKIILIVGIFLMSTVLAYPDCDQCGVCQDEYKPVCASDGTTYTTYHNACHVGCEKSCRTPGLKIVHDGECGNPRNYNR